MQRLIYLLFFITLSTGPATLYAASESAMKEDKSHINRWNTFATRIHTLLLQSLEHFDMEKQESAGGYGKQWPDFYTEESYYQANNGKLISRIQWERANPNNIHMIEYYIYDEQGRVKVDYLAAYLPQGRNAPVQTLINVHHYNDQLHAFRQFDANGELIHEQCKGKFFDQAIHISLDDDEIYNRFAILTSETDKEAYQSCFEYMSREVGSYINPLKNSPFGDETSTKILTQSVGTDALDTQLANVSTKIAASPSDADLLIERGQLYFQTRQFELAISDYNTAIKLAPEKDQAWFGRGMARGRAGDIEAGIADLTVYIHRNPSSSLAYTKRGVRNIWAGNMAAAKHDLLSAVEINASNAEAHDDLGVVYSSEKDYPEAIRHFKLSIKHDPSYAKAHHNLATAYTLTRQYERALAAINSALRLAPEVKNSLLLKSTILAALGQKQEALAIREHAQFLPDGNWSERYTIQ